MLGGCEVAEIVRIVFERSGGARRAPELAGVSRDTQAPYNVEVVRDSAGEPTAAVARREHEQERGRELSHVEGRQARADQVRAGDASEIAREEPVRQKSMLFTDARITPSFHTSGSRQLGHQGTRSFAAMVDAAAGDRRGARAMASTANRTTGADQTAIADRDDLAHDQPIGVDGRAGRCASGATVAPPPASPVASSRSAAITIVARYSGWTPGARPRRPDPRASRGARSPGRSPITRVETTPARDQQRARDRDPRRRRSPAGSRGS